MKSFRIAVRTVCIGLISLGAAHAATPGVDDGSIVLGQSAPFTGIAAPLGRSMRDGANLYFDKVNRTGGVHGRTIRLLSLDDGYQADRAIANTKRFIEDDGVFALFGYVGTPARRAVAPIVAAAHVPLLGVTAATDETRRPADKYVVNIGGYYGENAETLVDFLVAQGKRRIAVFYHDTYGESGFAAVQREMEWRDLPIVAVGAVDPDSLGVEDAVEVIAAARPDAVIIIGAARFADAFVREMDHTGAAPEYFNTATIRGDYKFEGFVMAKTLVDAIGQAGPDLTRDNLVAALERYRDEDEDYPRFSIAKESLPVVGINIISR